MGLTNTQYDAIMRVYSERALDDLRDMHARQKNAYTKVPALKQLDDEVSDLAVQAVELSLDGKNDAAEARRKKISLLRTQRAAILYNAGFPDDYMEMHYVCEDCQDTGFVDGHKCRCFDALVIDLFYTQSGLKETLRKENFSTFSFACYDDFPADETTGKTPRQNMHDIVGKCRAFLQDFDHSRESLLFYGGTGLGKTFLSNCIARELIESSHSVIYYSAPQLFDLLAKSRFSGESAEDFDESYLYDSDLLIIDDLGTEMTNSFVVSAFFRILNERIIRGKHMLISTNMSLGQLSAAYTERSFSRIMENFTILRFYGKDIRVKQK